MAVSVIFVDDYCRHNSMKFDKPHNKIGLNSVFKIQIQPKHNNGLKVTVTSERHRWILFMRSVTQVTSRERLNINRCVDGPSLKETQ